MLACAVCGYPNAASANFCRQCGNALKSTATQNELPASLAGAEAVQQTTTPVAASPSKVPTSRASSVSGAPPDSKGPAGPAALPPNDAALQAQLLDEAPDGDAAAPEPPTPPTEPLIADQAPAHIGVLTPGTIVGHYTIKELHEERDGQRIYRAQAPANVCQQCGTPATDTSDRFCDNCGAEILPYEVLLFEREGDDPALAQGPWRLVELPDEPIRALLPPITMVEAHGRRYLVSESAVPGFQSLAELLAARGDAPQQPAALDEADALPIALQLAHLLRFLHDHGTALGDLSLAQLLIGPKQGLRLRDANRLQPLTKSSRKADLLQLVRTLEDLTRTPRHTQKLDVETLAPKPTLDAILVQGRLGQLSDAAAWVAAIESIAKSRQTVQSLRATVGAATSVGMQRQLNEDSFLVQEAQLGLEDQLLQAGMYVVADGMGGHEGGEVASRLAVRAVAESVAAQLAMLATDAPTGIEDNKLHDLVLTAVEAANKAVYGEAQRRNNDMGTTLTLAVVIGDRCAVGNVGDSRTYLLHGGQLKRISRDHSLVMRLVEVGQITEDEIYTHPHRSAILRSLGEKPNVEADVFPLRLESGDALFLCSDGQWEMVRDPRMNEVINATNDPQAAAEQLVDEANRNGGEDNITTVVVRFTATKRMTPA